MSQQANDSMRESAGAVKSGAGAAGKAAKTGVKAGKKAFSKGTRTASSLIPLKVKLIALGVVAIILLIIGMREGFNEAQFDENFYNTAMHEDGTIQPKDKIESDAATWDMGRAIHQTLDLAEIIHEAKRKEIESIQSRLSKSGSTASTVICETDSMPILVNSDYPETYPSGGASGGKSGGEIIAQTAERMAYPEGTPDSQRDYDSGARGTDAMTAARDKYHSDWSPYKYACCCHSTGLILSEALGTPIGSLLPNKNHDAAKKYIEGKLKGLDFEVFDFDGNESSLQRGDVLTFSESYGHTFIYLGNGKTCEGHRSLNQFSCIEKYGGDPDPSDCTYFFVIRKKGGVSAGASGVSRSREDVINGACAWAEAIANNNEFHYGEASWAHHNGCYFCGSQPSSKKHGGGDWEKTYCCNPFVHAAYAHGGGDPTMLKRCKNCDGYGTYYGDGWSGDSNWKNMGYISFSKLQKGDVLLNGHHAMLYIGGGKVAHAGSPDNGVKGSDSWNESIRIDGGVGYNEVVRYFGKGGGTMEIPEGGAAGAPQFTKKTSETILETIGRGTGTRASIPRDGAYCVAQSFAYTGTHFAVAMTTGPETGVNGEVFLCDKNGNVKSMASGNIYHANGSTATPDGTVLVAGHMNGSEDSAVTFKTDGNSISNQGSAKLPTAASGAALDRTTGNYIFRKGGTISVYDQSKTKQLISFSEPYHGSHYQDIGAHGGFIFAVHCDVKGGEYSGNNYIDIYNETNGDYCGSYQVKYGEVESCDIVDDELVLLVHIKGSGANYIQFTGIKINSGNMSGGSGGITQSDMDILASYSVSISNTGIYKEKEEKSSLLDIIEGDQSTNNYRDATGRKLKLYWFGENRGRINYTRDLKAKIDGFWHNIRFYESPLSGKAAEKAMKEDGIDPATGQLSETQGSSETFTPLVVSAYRTNEQQAGIYGDGSDPLVAKPGHSEHECGLAVDIIDSKSSELIGGDPLVDAQADTPAQKWLMENCAKYGFILRYPKDKESITKIGYEPWHYRYVGKEHAEKIMSKGLCLEEYVSTLSKKDIDWKLVLVNEDNKIPDNFSVSPASIKTKYIQGNDESKTIDSRVLSSLTQMLDDCKKAGSGKKDSSSSASGDVIYIRERPIEDILIDMGLSPEDPYSNSGNPNMLAAKNIEAVYGISDNTTHMLFNGVVLPGITTESGLVWGEGTLKMPLPKGFTVTSWAGYRPPEDTNGVGTTNHSGLDLAMPTGTRVSCSLAGTVTKAEYYGGYGNCIIIKSPGNIEIIYAHLSEISVSTGQTIQVGQVIGKVGSTGNSTGPHLHFEVHKNGKVVDPAPLLGLTR